LQTIAGICKEMRGKFENYRVCEQAKHKKIEKQREYDLLERLLQRGLFAGYFLQH
jgi:hypothetical protein